MPFPYSEYCTFSAQQRYFEYEPFRKQMYKIHRPHLLSGYLAGFRYEETRDDEGKRDWIMYYEPGPKARAEYRSFIGDKQRVVDAAPVLAAGGETTNETPLRRLPQRQRRLNLQPEQEPSAALGELTKRGIGAGKALALIASADPEVLINQLEWGDYLVANARSPIVNPPGFYIHLLSTHITPPETFETSRRRKAREAAQAAREQALALRYERERAYETYRAEAVEQHMAEHVSSEEIARLTAEKTAGARKQFKNLPPETIAQIAGRAVRITIVSRLALPTFEEFCAKLDREEAIGAN